MDGSGYGLPFLSGRDRDLSKHGAGEIQLCSAEATKHPEKPGKREWRSETGTFFLSLFKVIGEPSPGGPRLDQSSGDKIYEGRSPFHAKQIHTLSFQDLEGNKGDVQ